MTEYIDYPLNQLALTVLETQAKGGKAYLKFSCDWCGSRQTIDTPNRLYTEGRCEECNGITDIARKGGNLLIWLPLSNHPESISRIARDDT